LLVFDYPSVLDRVDEVVGVLDVRPQQVLIEATIMSASLTDNFSAGIDFSVLQGVNFEDIGATSTDGTSYDVGEYTSESLREGAGTADSNLLDILPSGGLNIGYLNHGVAIFVKALQQLTDTTILANPRVVALNKQRGEVLLGRRDGYLTSIVTETSTTQRVEFLETGTRLVFRPFIGEDEFIRLEIHPEDSDGGVSAEGLPFKDTAEVTTNVLVRSGQTIVIGGLFRERTQEIEKKIPWLSEIPFVGNIFRSTQELSGREEIIVMLTPHIIDPGGDNGPLASGGVAGGLVASGALAAAYVYTARAAGRGRPRRGAHVPRGRPRAGPGAYRGRGPQGAGVH
jgi:type II secretory pathway component GspD/PulD (secretin)